MSSGRSRFGKVVAGAALASLGVGTLAVVLVLQSVPDTIPDCHSSRARAAIAAAVASGEAAAVRPLREVGRTTGPEGSIVQYECEVAVVDDENAQELVVFEVREDEGKLRASLR